MNMEWTHLLLLDCVSPVWENPERTHEYSTNIGHVFTAFNKINALLIISHMLIDCKSANEKSTYIILTSHVYLNTGSRSSYFNKQHDTYIFWFVPSFDISELCNLGILYKYDLYIFIAFYKYTCYWYFWIVYHILQPWY